MDIRSQCLLVVVLLCVMSPMALAGSSVYVDDGGGLIPVPTIVGHWNIFDLEIGPQYDSVGIEANVGHYLCTANFQAAYPEAEGYYLWSKSGNWDSIGLTVCHVKRVYNFLTDPMSWTQTGAGQTARDLGMDDITVAGPTRQSASIGLDDLPVLPEGVGVSLGTSFWFNVNINSGHNVVLDQYADIEQFNITNSGAMLTINTAGTLRCRQGLNNSGDIYGAIQYVGGPGLTNSGLIQSYFGLVEGGLQNLPGAEIRCEGGTITGQVINDGLLETWDPTTIDTLAISGGGTFVAKDTLTLKNSSDPSTGVMVEQALTSHHWLYAENPLHTPGGSIAAEGSAVINWLHGNLSVLPDKTLTFWGYVRNSGSVTVPVGSTLAMPRSESYTCGNDGNVHVHGTMQLAGPSSFPYHWAGNIFNNNGEIELIGGELVFSDFCSSHGTWKGPEMKGDGSIALKNGSRLLNPRVTRMGPITIDATSRVEFTPERDGARVLNGEIANDGAIEFSADGSLGGSLVNNGTITATGGNVTLQVPEIAGAGSVEHAPSAYCWLALESPDDPAVPVVVGQEVISRKHLKTPHSFTTTGAGIVRASGTMEGGVNGRFEVLSGKYISVCGSTFGPESEIAIDGAGTIFDWFTGTNEGLIEATGTGEFQTRGASFNVANTGEISVTDSLFDLPGPSSFPSNWTGQTLVNDGQIALNNSQMAFGAYYSYHGHAIGPVIIGSGSLALTNGSTLVDPYIAGDGTISIDATSRVEFNNDHQDTRPGVLHGQITNDGEIAFSQNGYLRGSLVNNGTIIATGGNVTLQLPEIAGAGSVEHAPSAYGWLALESPDDPTVPVIVGQEVISGKYLKTPHSFTTTGAGIVRAAGTLVGAVGGRFEVLSGEYLLARGSTFGSTAEITIDGAGTIFDWHTGTNEGLIQATGAGEFQTRGASFNVTNAGTISVKDALFDLPVPGSSIGYTGQTLNNSGLIDLDGSRMTFGCYSAKSLGPVIQGDGDIVFRNGSTVSDPYIATSGTITIDATSRVEVSGVQIRNNLLQGQTVNNGLIDLTKNLVLRGGMLNHGRIEVNAGILYFEMSDLFGDGELVVAPAGRLEFTAPVGHTGPVTIRHSIVSEGRITADDGVATADGATIHANGWFYGKLAGELEVNTGEHLSFGRGYGSGDTVEAGGCITSRGAGTMIAINFGESNGLVKAQSEGLVYTADHEIHNHGRIEVDTDSEFRVQRGSTVSGTSNLFIHDGTIDVDGGLMQFTSAGNKILCGSGDVFIHDGGTLRDPQITPLATADGVVYPQVFVDASSRIEYTSGNATMCDLQQFGHLQLDSNGIIDFHDGWEMMPGSSVSAGAGWHYIHLHGDWINRIKDPADFLLPMTIVEACSGTEDDPLTIEAASPDLGDTPDGWSSNFCLLKLEVLTGKHVRLVDQYDNREELRAMAFASSGDGGGLEAMYIHDLQLEAGAILDIGTINLYYDTLQGDPSQIIPEPTTLTLLACCMLPLLCRRRRYFMRETRQIRSSD